MNDWMDKFIFQCLMYIPWGRFRRRMEAELRDHMETLRQSLTEEEVLQAMGDPERLRKEYYTAWKQTPLCRACSIVIGVVAVWFLIFLSMTLTVVFPFTGVLLSKPGGLLSNGLASGAVLFLIPFSLGALFLRVCFREERRRALWVTLVLLISWVSFNWVFIVLMIGFEEINQYYEQALWMPLLLDRFPWLTPYLWTSFIGCLALGWLFGRKKKGSLA